jgi:hypothetical protein
MVQSEAFHAHQSEHRLGRRFCSGQHKKWLIQNTAETLQETKFREREREREELHLI